MSSSESARRFPVLNLILALLCQSSQIDGKQHRHERDKDDRRQRRVDADLSLLGIRVDEYGQNEPHLQHPFRRALAGVRGIRAHVLLSWKPDHRDIMKAGTSVPAFSIFDC